MPSTVKVKITDRAIITALNEPGGGVYKWRDEVARDVKANAVANAPVNDPMNALHRGGTVGLYKAGFDWDRRGSSGHHTIARITNDSDHAIYVELGRSGSSKMQIFSWTEWGGAIGRIGGPREVSRESRPLSRGELAFNERIRRELPKRMGSRTGDRRGEHILAKALAAALGSQGIAAMSSTLGE
jgi:hypothetical protein